MLIYPTVMWNKTISQVYNLFFFSFSILQGDGRKSCSSTKNGLKLQQRSTKLQMKNGRRNETSEKEYCKYYNLYLKFPNFSAKFFILQSKRRRNSLHGNKNLLIIITYSIYTVLELFCKFTSMCVIICNKIYFASSLSHKYSWVIIRISFQWLNFRNTLSAVSRFKIAAFLLPENKCWLHLPKNTCRADLQWFRLTDYIQFVYSQFTRWPNLFVS